MGKCIHTHLTIYPPLIMEDQLKVIIRCLVYNHEPYLRDCLEGFVMQQTNFPFKAVVHDDASTDNSAAIIREYAEKYPHIIEPIYETENQYSKHDGSLGRIMNAATLGRSPYIAYCEGDDYWIDPLKLQKQVDFLDANPDYTMCFSACKIIKEDERLQTNLQGEKIVDKDYNVSEVFPIWIVPTASICIRELVANDDRITRYDKRKLHGDIIIILTAAHRGKIRGMKDVMIVYRVHSSSVTQNQDSTLRSEKKCFQQYDFMKENFPLINPIRLKEAQFISQKNIISNTRFSVAKKLVAYLRAFLIWPDRTIFVTWQSIKKKIKSLFSSYREE